MERNHPVQNMGMSPNALNANYPVVDGKADDSPSTGKYDDGTVANDQEREHNGEGLLQATTRTKTALPTIDIAPVVRKNHQTNPITMQDNIMSNSRGPPRSSSIVSTNNAAPSLSAAKQSFLLATPTDRLVLNEMHSLIRQNVEVFVATEIDASQPQPGRKLPVEVGQIGIRCIHCKDLQLRRRAKRAVCYPSTISGIFHSVSNMKFDHFKSCPGMNEGLKEEFRRLRANCARKNPRGSGFSSTANYYMQSAKSQGLSDHANGIRLDRGKSQGLLALAAVAAETTTVPSKAQDQPHMAFHTNCDGAGNSAVPVSMKMGVRDNNCATMRQHDIQMHQPMLSSNHNHDLQRQHQQARHRPRLLAPPAVANGASGGFKKPLPAVNHVDYSQPTTAKRSAAVPCNTAVESNKPIMKNPPTVMHVNWDKFDGATEAYGIKRPYDGATWSDSIQSKLKKS